MADRYLNIEAGFFPYEDGSGHQVTVFIRRELANSEALISIESVGGVTVDQWKEITDGVARLLNSLPDARP